MHPDLKFNYVSILFIFIIFCYSARLLVLPTARKVAGSISGSAVAVFSGRELFHGTYSYMCGPGVCLYFVLLILIRSVISRSSSSPIVLTRLGGPLSRPFRIVEVPGIEFATS